MATELNVAQLHAINVGVLSEDEIRECLENTEEAIADLQLFADFLKAAARLKEAEKDKYGEITPQPMMPHRRPVKPTTVEWQEAWDAYFDARERLPSSLSYQP